MVVGIADQKTARGPDTLVTYALGSCVGVCLYDGALQTGGLAHVLLPETFKNGEEKNIYKFADTAVEALVRSMESLGCSRARMTAKIAGGACMFLGAGLSIGERNVEVVKKELNRFGIRLVAEDTGANYGRTLEFNTQDGTVTVKTAGRGSKIM